MLKHLSSLRITLLWILIFAGFNIHHIFHLADHIFGVDIKLKGADGTVPLSAHIFRIAVNLTVASFALVSLYSTKRIFYRLSFIGALALCLLNFGHFIEIVSEQPSDLSQVLLLLLIFIVNYMLVQVLHELSVPWKVLPSWMKWKWAKHQRRWFGKWHLYVGIFAGGILCIVGLTGSILVFQDEIDHALNPELFKVLEQSHRMTLPEAVEMVRESYPEKTFNYAGVTDEKTPYSTYRFREFDSDVEFFVNPYTGEICGKRIIGSSFIRIVMNIHTSLLIPKVGKYIVGISALCLLILTISGLRLWLPQKWKQLKSVLTVNFKASFKRQNYDWHNVLGFYSAPIIIVLSLTGFVITFNSVFIGLLFILNGKSPQAVEDFFGKKSAYKKEYVQLSAEQAYNKIKPAFSTVRLDGIRLPTDSLAAYTFYLKKKSNAKSERFIMVLSDQYNGKILLNTEKELPASAHSYLSWTIPLHYGTFGGLPTRILALLGSLIPLAMFVTGFIIWWPRYKKQKGNSKKRAVVAPKKTKLEIKHDSILMLPVRQYWIYYFKNGLKYAIVFLLISLTTGALYGMIAGIVLAPAMYVFIYLSMALLVNFVVSLLVVTFNLLFLVSYQKSYKPIYKYFAYSAAFFVVFMPLCMLFFNSGWDVF